MKIEARAGFSIGNSLLITPQKSEMKFLITFQKVMLMEIELLPSRSPSIGMVQQSQSVELDKIFQQELKF